MRTPLLPLAVVALSTSITVLADRPPQSAPRLGAPSLEESANAAYPGIRDRPLTLSNGRWQGPPFVQGSEAAPQVVLADTFQRTGDLNGDGRDDTVVLLAVSEGGSGSVVHLAALGRVKGRATALGSAEVGDRVQVRDGRIENGRIVLDVVRAGPGDAMCCPGEKASVTWQLRSGRLMKAAEVVTGRASPADIGGTEWHLTHFTWDERVPDSAGVTLRYSGGHVVGQSGCNRYSGPVVAGESRGQITIGPIAGTRMACSGPADAIEHRYLDALGHGRSYSFVAGSLAITYEAHGEPGTLRFQPAPHQAQPASLLPNFLQPST